MSGTGPLVSIIMASYNAEEFILQAVESILNQSYKHFELIIIDDGSTDNTSNIIEPFRNDSRIKYIFQKNAGQTIAKNRGISESSGNFIAFCDADDYWHPNKLDIQLAMFLENPKIGVVYSDIQAVDQQGLNIKVGQLLDGKSGNILNDLLFDNFIPFGSAMIRKQCLDEHGAFNEQYRMGIDWDLWLRISTSWEFGFTPQKLYFYREWAGQMSRNYKGRYNGAILILENFRKRFPILVPPKLFRQAKSDIYANYAYHVSLYEGYNAKLFTLSAKALLTGADKMSSIKRVGRALLRRF
jgi:glycosyltransferase involved in cell wall biosynthesis